MLRPKFESVGASWANAAEMHTSGIGQYVLLSAPNLEKKKTHRHTCLVNVRRGHIVSSKIIYVMMGPVSSFHILSSFDVLVLTISVEKVR